VVSAAQGRDEAAFARLYALCAPRAWQQLVRLSGDEVVAAELLQDVFVNVWNALPSWRGDSQVGTWIHRIAVNAWLQHVRARERRSAHEVAHDELDGLAGIAAPARDPLQQIDLERAIAALPHRMRTAFVLRDIEGMEFDEIAAITGTATGTIRAQVSRARTLLARELAR
jgi:RNA polymerase sigma-70 factor, ECF subfamily